MKERQNIDDIFKKSFNNIEADPSPRVWENIQAVLQKEKKERRVIPLWVKVGGVAALLAILFSVGNWVYDPSHIDSPSITEENVPKTDKENNDINTGIIKEVNSNESQVASEETTPQNESIQSLNISNENVHKEKNQSESLNRKAVNSAEKSSKTLIASGNSDTKNSKSKENSQQDLIEKNSYRKDLNGGIAVAKNTSEKIISDTTSEDVKTNKANQDQTIFDTQKEGVAAINGNSERSNTDKYLLKPEEEIVQDANNKKSIFDAIAENNEENTVAEKTKKEKPEQRWNVAPNVAPVYYSSLGNGSSIDPTFADNPQKGDVTMSYGVQVSYAFNNRLSVRTGLNNVDLSYSTSGIEVGTGPVAVALQSVDYGGKQIVVTAADKGSFAAAAPSNGFGDITPKSTQGDARLIQNINYFEVPVELKYALVNSRFGINVIGGLSTLFLGNNEISIKADNFNTVLGDANNLSSVSFSTNVGLGLDYKLSKKFTFNIEPMFKYQLNPYTDSSVDYKPYYMGVYSGFSFKF